MKSALPGQGFEHQTIPPRPARLAIHNGAAPRQAIVDQLLKNRLLLIQTGQNFRGARRYSRPVDKATGLRFDQTVGAHRAGVRPRPS